MKSYLFIFFLLLFFLLSSCVPNIHFNNLFEANPGFLLHYLALLEDVTPPEINFSVPSNYETEISRNRSILVVYDEPILASSVTSDTIKVYAGSEEVKGSIKVSKNSLGFKPETYFLANTKHRVKVQNTVRDLSGNVKPVLQEETLEFTTGNDIDTIAPAFKESTPSTGATDVATNSGINLVFTEVLDPQTVTDENMVLKQGDNIVEKTITYYGSVVQIKPISSEGMQSFTTYQININTGIKDLAGNALASAQTISFTTNDTSDKTPPAVESTIPSDTAVDISNNTPIIFNLSEIPDVTSIKNDVLKVEELDSNGIGSSVAGSISLDNKSLIFQVNDSYRTNTKHRVTLINSLKDMAGNALLESKVITFTTARLVTYTIGGSVSGLSGTLVLQNNGGDDLSLSSNGSFTFSKQVSSSYIVSVKTQPTGQTCTITNGSGTAASNVTNVNVTCVTAAYTISGLVGGLGTGLNVVLQNTVNSESKTIGANGSFSFTNKVSYNGSYAVTVTTHPTNQSCMITDGSGTNVIGDISNILVDCNNLPGTTVQSFTDNGDGTIKDNNTGLIWQKCSMEQNSIDCSGTATTAKWANAGSYCTGLSNLPTTNPRTWRLPSKDELVSIVDYSVTSGAVINTTFFPNTVTSGYWSSTTYAPDMAYAWYVYFSIGRVVYNVKTGSGYVRCVSGP
ncbi:MAG: Ig-like domain-containing protein [Leptospiraceae bacterium]|nr:Ig-like domain-containing protein [Leptospiraceae bacterium]